MAESMIHFIEFCELRDKLESEPDRIVRERLLEVCHAEKATATEALKLTQNNSILGFSCEGQGSVRGGYFTPGTIEEKLIYLDETISELKAYL